MDLLFWIYLINATVLIVHEIDSAYWQEWKLIDANIKNGINAFILLHIPLVIIVLLGLIWVYENTFTGLVFSFLLSASGIFAFFFHFYHLRKGKSEFNTILSKSIIVSTFIISIFQAIVTWMKMV